MSSAIVNRESITSVSEIDDIELSREQDLLSKELKQEENKLFGMGKKTWVLGSVFVTVMGLLAGGIYFYQRDQWIKNNFNDYIATELTGFSVSFNAPQHHTVTRTTYVRTTPVQYNVQYGYVPATIEYVAPNTGFVGRWALDYWSCPWEVRRHLAVGYQVTMDITMHDLVMCVNNIEVIRIAYTYQYGRVLWFAGGKQHCAVILSNGQLMTSTGFRLNKQW